MTWQNIGTFTPSFEWQAAPIAITADKFAVSVASVNADSWTLTPLLIRVKWPNGFVSRPSKLWLELNDSQSVVFPLDQENQNSFLEFKKMGKAGYHSTYSVTFQQHIP
jgi:hypothetical protein